MVPALSSKLHRGPSELENRRSGQMQDPKSSLSHITSIPDPLSTPEVYRQGRVKRLIFCLLFSKYHFSATRVAQVMLGMAGE